VDSQADVLERLLSTADLAPNVERDSASGFGTHAHLLFDDMIKVPRIATHTHTRRARAREREREGERERERRGR